MDEDQLLDEEIDEQLQGLDLGLPKSASEGIVSVSWEGKEDAIQDKESPEWSEMEDSKNPDGFSELLLAIHNRCACETLIALVKNQGWGYDEVRSLSCRALETAVFASEAERIQLALEWIRDVSMRQTKEFASFKSKDKFNVARALLRGLTRLKSRHSCIVSSHQNFVKSLESCLPPDIMMELCEFVECPVEPSTALQMTEKLLKEKKFEAAFQFSLKTSSFSRIEVYWKANPCLIPVARKTLTSSYSKETFRGNQEFSFRMPEDRFGCFQILCSLLY
jgi:hypothetical protein